VNQGNTNLADKVVWVTGGSSGIGLHCAVKLAREGARVIISGRRSSQIDAAISQYPDLGLIGMAVDVSDKQAVALAAQKISEHVGTVDILINSAGINIPNRSWATLDAEAFDRVVSINLKGTMYCILAALPGMRTKQDGLVINIASWAGRFVSGLTGPSYTSAKHAVCAMSLSLNMEECVNGIRSTTILPGEVATPILMSRAVPPSDEEQSRMLQPEQVADAVLLVAKMPASVCMNEILMSPTWNRSYPAVQAKSRQQG